MTGTGSMTSIISHMLSLKRGFVLEVKGNVWENVTKFIHKIETIVGEFPGVCPVEKNCEEQLYYRNCYQYVKDWNKKMTLIVSDNPYEAVNGYIMTEHDVILVIVKEKPESKEWYDNVELLLETQRSRRRLNVVFFSYNNIPPVSDNITIDASFIWVENEGDFTIQPVLDGIELMFSKFKEGIYDLTDLVDEITKVKE